MSKAGCLFLMALLVGCHRESHPDQKAEFLGVWVSNKALTLESINSAGASVPDELKNSLGEMAYVFRPEQTTFTPVGTENTQDRWYKWHVVESQPEYAVIENSGLGRAPAKVRFVKEQGCLGLRPEGQAFTEYFCRR